MKQRIFLFFSILFLSFSFVLPALAAEVATGAVESPVTDYNAAFASLAVVVAAIPVVVEVCKRLFRGMPAIVVRILSWVVGIGITMLGWWQGLGFLDGIPWYIALLYGAGAGLAANGIADTGLIDWVIGLFAAKKKV